jgi:hypothetical protein
MISTRAFSTRFEMEMMNSEFIAEIRPSIAKSGLKCGARTCACYLGLGIPKLVGVLIATNDSYCETALFF